MGKLESTATENTVFMLITENNNVVEELYIILSEINAE